MSNRAFASRRLVKSLAAFEYEANAVYCTIVVPRWNSPPWRNRLPHILYGCVMWCFSWIDRLSVHWKGTASPKGQTKRMVDFMEAYLNYPRRESSVAIKLWRHTLMHTGEPRPLQDIKTGMTYTWLLHWGSELPRADHLTLSAIPPRIQLNMALFYLVQDLKQAQRKYLAHLAASGSLQTDFDKADQEMTATDMKFY